jgi:phage shock protein E
MNRFWICGVWALFGACGVLNGPAVAAESPVAPESTATGGGLSNPAIDMDAFLRVSSAAARHRANHRVSEEEFLRMSREPRTVILDARSREKYDELHVRGAVHLSFPDMTAASLKALVPDPATPILIYCNNNFANAEGPFPRKRASASLNLSTFVALYDYGYRNVYELAPLLDIRTTRIPLESAPSRTR